MAAVRPLSLTLEDYAHIEESIGLVPEGEPCFSPAGHFYEWHKESIGGGPGMTRMTKTLKCVHCGDPAPLWVLGPSREG